MIHVEFESIAAIDDALFAYAVIVSRSGGRWIYSRHRQRGTWEIPGGKREPSENILDTARRELFEETGALDFELSPVCAYSVQRSADAKSYGLLCYAEIQTLGALPASEIESIRFFDAVPENLTYPEIQPLLHRYVVAWLAR